MTELRREGASLIRQSIATLAVSTIFVLGCSDSSSPTEPTLRQPIPAASLAPVVQSVDERPTDYYQWVIRGSNLRPNTRATFESSGSVIRLEISDNFDDERVPVAAPRGTAPGAYTPCVETDSGKGCGSFLVTVTP